MNKNILKQQAVPGNSMWSYDMHTQEIEFVATVFFDKSEIGKTVKYYVVPKEGDKLYIQAPEPFTAKRKIQLFLNHKKVQYEKEQNADYQGLQK